MICNISLVLHKYINNIDTGLIGPEHSSEAGNTSLLLRLQRPTDRLVQIGFSTTAASLSNTNLYLNFNRVVPSDDVQIEVDNCTFKTTQ